MVVRHPEGFVGDVMKGMGVSLFQLLKECIGSVKEKKNVVME